jgi:hypothetical protein
LVQNLYYNESNSTNLNLDRIADAATHVTSDNGNRDARKAIIDGDIEKLKSSRS